MSKHQPTFSIIVPTYNRPKSLAKCLQALALLDYPCDRFEAIVVDDGSPTPLDAVVESFHNRLNVVLLRQTNSGPATARNTGAARAKGEFLAFTDDDCSPATDWLQTLAVRFARAPEHAIGGRTINVLNNPYSTASQILIDYLYEYYNVDNQGRFFASNNLALPTEGFRTIGGFDTSFPLAAAEDRDFCDRWLHCGNQMLYAPEVLVYHAHALTLCAFCRQHFNYGRGAYHFHQTRARRGAHRLKLEPKSFYLNLVLYPFSRGQRSQVRRRAFVVAALLSMSQVANAAGFFYERAKQRESTAG